MVLVRLNAMSLAALLGAAACSPSEIVVFVDAEQIAVPCDIDRVAITIEGSGDPVTRTETLGSDPLSLTILHDGGGSWLKITATGEKGETPVYEAFAVARFKDGDRISVPIVLTPECTVDEPCDLTDSYNSFTELAPQARGFCSRGYSIARQSLPFRDACALAGLDGDTFALVDTVEGMPSKETAVPQHVLEAFAPFNFEFYGKPVEQIWVGDNGYLVFAEEDPDIVQTFLPLDSAAVPAPVVLGFWDDLVPRQNACVAVQDQGDKATLWITWKNACFFTAPSGCDQNDELTFSIGLESGTNNVIVNYQTLFSPSSVDRAKGGSATVGVRSLPTGRDPPCQADECGDDGLCDATGEPCGYTQALSHTVQNENWPTTFVFDSNDN